MKTKYEIFDELDLDLNGNAKIALKIIESIEIIQKEAWNEAVESASNMVEMDFIDGEWEIDKESILKLKK